MKYIKENILKIKSNSVYFFLLLIFFFNTPSESFAKDGKFDNPLDGTNSLSQFFARIVDALIELGTVVSALGIMYGGFMLVTAQGDEEKIASGRKTITWAMVGTAVLLGAKVLFVVIKGTVTELSK